MLQAIRLLQCTQCGAWLTTNYPAAGLSANFSNVLVTVIAPGVPTNTLPASQIVGNQPKSSGAGANIGAIVGAAMGAFVLAGEVHIICRLVPCCLVSKQPTDSLRPWAVCWSRGLTLPHHHSGRTTSVQACSSGHTAGLQLPLAAAGAHTVHSSLSCCPVGLSRHSHAVSCVPSVLAILVGWRVKRHRHNRKVWKRDLETARAKPAGSLEGSSDSNSSGGPAGKKPLAMTYVPFGVGSNDSVDATPHAKHATGLDAFAGQRRQRAELKAGRSGRSTGHPLTDSAGGNNNMGTNMSG